IAFDGEENRLLGSEALVRDGAAGQVDLALSLDVLGTSGLALNGLSPELPLEIAKAAAEAAKAEGVPLDFPLPQLVLSRALPDIERSDHGPSTRAHIPAFQLYSRGEDGFDPHYHSPSDRASRLSTEDLDAAARWILAFVARADPVAGKGGEADRFLPLLPS